MIHPLSYCGLAVFCLRLLCTTLQAEDAYFSADGKQVTFIPWGVDFIPPISKHLGEIGHLDLAAKKITPGVPGVTGVSGAAGTKEPAYDEAVAQ